MQVTLNNQSPNFNGFKLAPEAREGLKNKPFSVIKDLADAAKDLKPLKIFDVEVLPNLKCKITSKKEAYFGPFVSDLYKGTMHDTNIILSDVKGCCDLYGVARHDNPTPEYSIWNSYVLDSVDRINSIRDVVVELDKVAAKKAAEDAANKSIADAIKEETSKAVDKLYEDFA